MAADDLLTQWCTPSLFIPRNIPVSVQENLQSIFVCATHSVYFTSTLLNINTLYMLFIIILIIVSLSFHPLVWLFRKCLVAVFMFSWNTKKQACIRTNKSKHRLNTFAWTGLLKVYGFSNKNGEHFIHRLAPKCLCVPTSTYVLLPCSSENFLIGKMYDKMNMNVPRTDDGCL